MKHLNTKRSISCKKKPSVVHTLRITRNEGVEIVTSTNKITGKFGDYLMIGINGEKCLINSDIFENTYTVII